MIRNLLMRTFGRPQGLLGRWGGRIMADSNRPCAAWAVDELRALPLESALEIGFGPGVAIELLCTATDAGRICGVDPSEEMHRQATARNQAAITEGRVELSVGVAERLPYADGSFDAVLSINSLQLWDDPQRGLGEIRRTLKPGGRLLLCFTQRSGQTPTGLTETLQRAGFRDVRLITEADDWFAVAGITHEAG